MASKVLASIALILSFIATISAIPTISTRGNKFFDSNGKQFFIKGTRAITPPLITANRLGIAYQLVPHDPLIDTKQCQLDASLMEKLGANAIRVYHVDPLGDHEGCMSAFADAGIYLFVDLDDFHTDIDPVCSSPPLSSVSIANVQNCR